MIETYWKKGISFESYLHNIEKKIEAPEKHDLDEEKIQKCKLSLERAEQIMQNYFPDSDHENILNEKNFNGKILIIAEDWCGDCSQAIPVIKKFFEEKNAVKILYRDENPDLMKLFLTSGSESVPIVIILDVKSDIICHWGPRTAFGFELLAKYKNDPEKFPKEMFLSELQEYYETNKGFDIIDEIVSLL